jgi:hypothetical protein
MHAGRYSNGGIRYQLELSTKCRGRGDKEVCRGRLYRSFFGTSSLYLPLGAVVMKLPGPVV